MHYNAVKNPAQSNNNVQITLSSVLQKIKSLPRDREGERGQYVSFTYKQLQACTHVYLGSSYFKYPLPLSSKCWVHARKDMYCTVHCDGLIDCRLMYLCVCLVVSLTGFHYVIKQITVIFVQFLFVCIFMPLYLSLSLLCLSPPPSLSLYLSPLPLQSPTSLKVSHRQLREGKKRSFEECLMIEYRMSQRHIVRTRRKREREEDKEKIQFFRYFRLVKISTKV